MEDARVAILEKLCHVELLGAGRVIEGKEAMAARSQQSPGMGRIHVRSTLRPVSAILRRTWDSQAGYPSTYEKTQESGQGSPSTESQNLLRLVGERLRQSRKERAQGTTENTLRIPRGLPSAPWQMSVRVAPSTMNWGFENSSCKEPESCLLGQPS